MKVGFTGTRHGMSDEQRRAFIAWVKTAGVTVLHHGGCQGADVQAAWLVRESVGPDCGIICHPGPDDDPYQEFSGVDNQRRLPKTHFARNRDIVNETEHLIACPVDMTEQPRGGTWYTIKFARKIGRPLTIIYPDGTVTTEAAS